MAGSGSRHGDDHCDLRRRRRRAARTRSRSRSARPRSAASRSARIPTLFAATGGTSTITATVFDINGNPLPGVPVTFSTDSGHAQRRRSRRPTQRRRASTDARPRTGRPRSRRRPASPTTGGGTGTTGTTAATAPTGIGDGERQRGVDDRGRHAVAGDAERRTCRRPSRSTYTQTRQRQSRARVTVDWGDGSRPQTISAASQPPCRTSTATRRHVSPCRATALDTFGDTSRTATACDGDAEPQLDRHAVDARRRRPPPAVRPCFTIAGDADDRQRDYVSVTIDFGDGNRRRR